MDIQTLSSDRGRLHLPDLLRHRLVGARGQHLRILRRRQGHPPDAQRHGDRGRLDVGGLVHLDGGPDRVPRLCRRRLSDGLDRRLRPDGAASGALPAQVRQVHGARVHRRPVLLHDRAHGGGDLSPRDLADLRDRPDARRRHRLLQHPQPADLDRSHHRHGRRRRLRGDGRHEGHHLHADRAVRDHDLRLHGSGGVHLSPVDRALPAADRAGIDPRRIRHLHARRAEQDRDGSRLRSLYRPRRHGHVQHVPSDAVADDRDGRTSARDRPVLHRAENVGRAILGGLRPDLHRPSLHRRSGGRGDGDLQHGQHDPDRPGRRTGREPSVRRSSRRGWSAGEAPVF